MVSIRLLMQAASTGTGTQAIAPSGMTATPKLDILAMTAGVTPGTIANPYNFDIGHADGTVQRAIALLSRNGAAAGITTQGGRYDTATCLQHTLTTSNGKDGSAAHSSFAAGTHTIDYDNTDTLAAAFQYLAVLVGGADVTFETVEFASDVTIDTPKDAPTLSTITDPNFVFVYGRGNAAFASETNFAARSFSMGFAIRREDGSTIEQFCISDVGSNNATSARTGIYGDRCAKRLTAGADQGGIELTTWKSNTAAFTTRDVGEVTNWVMVFGKFTKNRLRCITGTTTAGSTGDKTLATPGAPTKAYCLIATELGAVGTSSTAADASKWSYGWVDEASAQACVGVQMEPSAATGDARSIARNDHVVDVLDDAGTHSWSATHVSKDASVVVNVDDAAAGDRAFGLLTISEDLSEPGWLPATRRFRRQLARM